MVESHTSTTLLLLINFCDFVGEKWRELRHTMTPTFSSGKVKILYELMIEQAENFVEHFKNQSKADFQEVEVKDAFSR